MWVALSLLSAFGQALAWALKKKVLHNKDINNTLGFVSCLVAGIVLTFAYGFYSGWTLPLMSHRFLMAAIVVIVVNVLARWAAYRALDEVPFSLLMPFVPLSSLGIIPVEYALRGVFPNGLQLLGIIILLGGAVLFAFKQVPDRKTLAAAGYFCITLVCYAIAPPFTGVAVEECGSGLFFAAVFHLGMALGFVPLLVMSNEQVAVMAHFRTQNWRWILWLMIASGLVAAFFENGPATIALETAKASEVFALKRTMPFFALVLGVFMFNEKVTRKHTFGTALLVIGSALIVWYK